MAGWNPTYGQYLPPEDQRDQQQQQTYFFENTQFSLPQPYLVPNSYSNLGPMYAPCYIPPIQNMFYSVNQIDAQRPSSYQESNSSYTVPMNVSNFCTSHSNSDNNVVSNSISDTQRSVNSNMRNNTGTVKKEYIRNGETHKRGNYLPPERTVQNRSNTITLQQVSNRGENNYYKGQHDYKQAGANKSSNSNKSNYQESDSTSKTINYNMKNVQKRNFTEYRKHYTSNVSYDTRNSKNISWRNGSDYSENPRYNSYNENYYRRTELDSGKLNINVKNGYKNLHGKEEKATQNMLRKSYGMRRAATEYNPNRSTNSISNEVKPPQLSFVSRKTTQTILSTSSQRERLEMMIRQRLLECLVCCEKIRHQDRVWSCAQCYNILHLNCIAKWAKASCKDNSTDGWRCPACQKICAEIPREYRCYCGKILEPKISVAGETPHSCGEICGRNSSNVANISCINNYFEQTGISDDTDTTSHCKHRCQLVCHPGPCPECEVPVERACGCGRTKQRVKCSSQIDVVCSATKCDKELNCSIHKCYLPCHTGPCPPCKLRVRQHCFCGKQGRTVLCTYELQLLDDEIQQHYACDDACEKEIACGHHKCAKKCHPGDCGKCPFDVNVITSCNCGKTTIFEQDARKNCMDPVPCCEQTCEKLLKCGPLSEPHRCQLKCHEGDCSPCEFTTNVKCRCGNVEKEYNCKELLSKTEVVTCKKKCIKKRTCTRHKCNQFCCIDEEHICPQVCNRLLSCGQHRCEDICHSGKCRSCLRTSFQELYCECGTECLLPPIACGTRPPACKHPCPRQRSCGHAQNHSCHTWGDCPPCTVLTEKWCHGHHEQRGAIQCHIDEFSCGLKCAKPLPCDEHTCQQTCHKSSCAESADGCTQPCLKRRPDCPHECAAPCHSGKCPSKTCRKLVSVTCQCGLLTGQHKACVELQHVYREQEMSRIAEKMAELNRGGTTVDISDMIADEDKTKEDTTTSDDASNQKGRKKNSGEPYKILECTEECRVYERNKRLALGLQIRNPDFSQKLTPKYSEYMRQWTKKDPKFCEYIHLKLTELVQLAKQSKQQIRSYSFECMNREKRHFVHEYCEHFGVESVAYDAEPNRNIVATASRDRSWLPSYSLLEVIQRENGQRKVPGPSRLNEIIKSPATNITLKTSQPVNQALNSLQKITDKMPTSSPVAWSGRSFNTVVKQYHKTNLTQLSTNNR